MICHSKPIGVGITGLLLLMVTVGAFGQSDKASTFLRQSRILVQQEHYREAGAYADSAILFLQHSRQVDSLAAAYLWRHEIHQLTGNDKKALQDFKLAAIFRDSIRNAEFQLRVGGLRDSLAVEQLRREKENKAMNDKLDDLAAQASFEKRSLLIMVAGLVVLCLMVVLNLWRRNRENQRLLRQSQDDVQAMGAFRDKLFAVISYDLKGSFTSFQNLAESLSKKIDAMSLQDSRQFLLQIQKDAISLRETLGNVVHWVALQANAMPFHPEVFDCKKVAEEVMQKARHRLTGRQLTGDLFIPDHQFVFADRMMVEMILDNLLSNAIQFTRPGGVITCFSGKKDGLVMVGVKDTGSGISAENMARLFKVDEDLHGFGNSSQKGAGVGLILCKELVERNGGKIEVESKEGEGSTFYFTLPEKKP